MDTIEQTPVVAQKKLRGFAAMPKERLREIAHRGGKMAQEKKTGHRFTSEEAKAAGRKGGLTVSRKRGREYMQTIGRKGQIASLPKRIKQLPIINPEPSSGESTPC